MRRILISVYRFRGPLYLFSAVLLIAVAVTDTINLPDDLAILRAVVAICAVLVFVLCVLIMIFGARLLEEHEVTVVAAPVRGRWLALNSPASKVPSHGVRMYGQAYAIDLVAEPSGSVRPEFGKGAPAMREIKEYPALGKPVFAMVDGVVVRASDWRRDHRARSNWFGLMYLLLEGAVRELGGPGFVIGNHVVIRDVDGRFALVAHLYRGSVTVGVGDKVQAGQQIGRCGNSGNSTEPHVHAQLMDRISPWTGQGIPMAFAGIRLDDSSLPEDGLPANGQHLEAD